MTATTFHFPVDTDFARPNGADALTAAWARMAAVAAAPADAFVVASGETLKDRIARSVRGLGVFLHAIVGPAAGVDPALARAAAASSAQLGLAARRHGLR